MRTICIPILLLSIFSCGENGTQNEVFLHGRKISNTDQQKRLIREVAIRSIPHAVSTDGYLRYKTEDYAEVTGIARTVIHGEELSETHLESTMITSDTQRTLLIEKFEAASVPFTIDVHQGNEHIAWRQVYGPTVDLIIQEVMLAELNSGT